LIAVLDGRTPCVDVSFFLAAFIFAAVCGVFELIYKQAAIGLECGEIWRRRSLAERLPRTCADHRAEGIDEAARFRQRRARLRVVRIRPRS
jgi:hypothetical protein